MVFFVFSRNFYMLNKKICLNDEKKIKCTEEHYKNVHSYRKKKKKNNKE